MIRLAASAAILALLARQAQADEITPFRTPSGNIHCIMIDGEDGMMVDCEMRQISRFTLPLKRPADCDLDWGNRFELAAQGRPGMSCYGDTVRDPAPRTLGYGQSIGSEALNCVSRQSGLSCENQAGHGFLLSKAKQKFW